MARAEAARHVDFKHSHHLRMMDAEFSLSSEIKLRMINKLPTLIQNEKTFAEFQYVALCQKYNSKLTCIDSTFAELCETNHKSRYHALILIKHII